MATGAIYTDSYFRYLFILMRYGADIERRRRKGDIFIFLQYNRVKFAILNDKKRNRIMLLVYYKEDAEKAFYEYVGQINIFGYYPKQIRKILYGLQKRIRDNEDGYRDRLQKKNITISRARAWNFKRYTKWK